MEITKCEFCNTRIANCEVHNCVRIGNQYRLTSATLPQLTFGDLAEDIELTTEKMECEERWPSMSQGNSSNQQNFLLDMHQQTDCEEIVAAEMYSLYDLSSPNHYSPANSDFHFSSKPSVEENEYKSVNFQPSSEPSKVLRSQNSQLSDASNPGHPANIPASLAQQDLLPGFQQTFGQRNAMMNRMDQQLKDSSQREYSRIYRTNEVFYSTRNLFHPTNITEQTENFPFTTLTCDHPLENLSFSSNSLCGNSEENSLITSETENSKVIIDTISTPGISHFFVQNRESCVINFDAIKCKVVENNPKNNQCTDGIADSVSCASNSNRTKRHYFGSEIINITELYTSENSSSVSGSLGSQKPCNISTRTTASEISANNKNRSEDKIWCKNVNLCKDLDNPSGNSMKLLNKCEKDEMTFLPTGRLEFPDHSPTVARPYNCKLCDKSYTRISSLTRHVLTHTVSKPYQCTECGRYFADRTNLSRHVSSIHTRDKPYACHKCVKRYCRNFDLKRHMLRHAGEDRSKCDSCGAEFYSEDSLTAHKCRKAK